MSITKKTVNDVRRRVYQIVHPIILLKSKLQSRYDVLSPTDRRYLHRGHPFVVKSPAVKGSRSERHPYNGDLYHQLFSRRNDNVRYLDKFCVHDRMSKIFTCSTKCAIFRQQMGALKRGIHLPNFGVMVFQTFSFPCMLGKVSNTDPMRKSAHTFDKIDTLKNEKPTIKPQFRRDELYFKYHCLNSLPDRIHNKNKYDKGVMQ